VSMHGWTGDLSYMHSRYRKWRDLLSGATLQASVSMRNVMIGSHRSELIEQRSSPATMSVKSNPFFTDFLCSWLGSVAKPTYSLSCKRSTNNNHLHVLQRSAGVTAALLVGRPHDALHAAPRREVVEAQPEGLTVFIIQRGRPACAL